MHVDGPPNFPPYFKFWKILDFWIFIFSLTRNSFSGWKVFFFFSWNLLSESSCFCWLQFPRQWKTSCVNCQLPQQSPMPFQSFSFWTHHNLYQVLCAAEGMMQVQLLWASLSEGGNCFTAAFVVSALFSVGMGTKPEPPECFSEIIGLRWKILDFQTDCMLSLFLPSEVTKSLESWIPPWLKLHVNRHVFCKIFGSDKAAYFDELHLMKMFWPAPDAYFRYA